MPRLSGTYTDHQAPLIQSPTRPDPRPDRLSQKHARPARHPGPHPDSMAAAVAVTEPLLGDQAPPAARSGGGGGGPDAAAAGAAAGQPSEQDLLLSHSTQEAIANWIASCYLAVRFACGPGYFRIRGALPPHLCPLQNADDVSILTRQRHPNSSIRSAQQTPHPLAPGSCSRSPPPCAARRCTARSARR